jgi:hypothetical protein
VRAVCVHLHNTLVAGSLCPLEAGEVCGAETPLARAMKHVHAGIRFGEPVRESPGAIRAGVVDHEQVDLVDGSEKVGGDPRQAGRFVVGRHDDEHPAPA